MNGDFIYNNKVWAKNDNKITKWNKNIRVQSGNLIIKHKAPPNMMIRLENIIKKVPRLYLKQRHPCRRIYIHFLFFLNSSAAMHNSLYISSPNALVNGSLRNSYTNMPSSQPFFLAGWQIANSS
jgi:hypothetical protein